MKKILFFTAVIMISSVSFSQTKLEDAAKFNTEKHDFGKIKQGIPAICYFEITNNLKTPLVIESATASCGCTVPEYPKEPISYSKTAKIKVEYSASGIGPFEKDVYIKIAGIDAIKVLKIIGEVVAPTSN